MISRRNTEVEAVSELKSLHKYGCRPRLARGKCFSGRCLSAIADGMTDQPLDSRLSQICFISHLTMPSLWSGDQVSRAERWWWSRVECVVDGLSHGSENTDAATSLTATFRERRLLGLRSMEALTHFGRVSESTARLRRNYDIVFGSSYRAPYWESGYGRTSPCASMKSRLLSAL